MASCQPLTKKAGSRVESVSQWYGSRGSGFVQKYHGSTTLVSTRVRNCSKFKIAGFEFPEIDFINSWQNQKKYGQGVNRLF
jgi:hypothetical protein